MADDYDNTEDIGNMADDELRPAEIPEQLDVEKDLLEGGFADITLLKDEEAGTHDVAEAISEAEPWIPPEGPTPEGVSGQNDGKFGIDGQR